jgi:tetratricopeptide (TPR) repeat protein
MIFDRALELDPENGDAYYSRGILYADKDEHEASLNDYNKALELLGDDGEIYTSRGAAHFFMDDLDASMADFDQAIAVDDQNVRAYNNRAVVKFVREDYESALEDYKIGAELMPMERLLMGGLAITYHALGNNEEAFGLWRALLAMDKRYANADYTGQEFLWPPALVEQARKLIADLEKAG